MSNNRTKIYLPLFLTLFSTSLLCCFSVQAQKLYPFPDPSEDNAWGYINDKGEVVIQPQYHIAGEFEEGYAVVMVRKRHLYQDTWAGARGVIDSLGNLVVPGVYESISEFSEGLAKAMLPEDSDSTALVDGYIDTTGKVVIPMSLKGYRFEKNGSFSEGLALHLGESEFLVPVSAAVKELVISLSEQQNIAVDTSKFYEKEILYGFIDKSGEVVLPHVYRFASSFSDGLALVVRYEDGKRGYINYQGDFVIELSSKSASFSEGMASVLDSIGKTKYGFINTQNKLVIPMDYNYWWSSGVNAAFSEGMCKVGKDTKYGFIDHTGALAIDTVYSRVGAFSEGLAAVGIPNKGEIGSVYGFVNQTGELMIPHKYRSVGFSPPEFKNGLCLVKVAQKTKDSLWVYDAGYINKRGEWVYGPIKAKWSIQDFVIE